MLDDSKSQLANKLHGVQPQAAITLRIVPIKPMKVLMPDDIVADIREGRIADKACIKGEGHGH